MDMCGKCEIVHIERSCPLCAAHENINQLISENQELREQVEGLQFEIKEGNNG